VSNGWRAGKYKVNEPKEGSDRGNAADPEGSTVTSPQAAWIYSQLWPKRAAPDMLLSRRRGLAARSVIVPLIG
jgi:hypothetical protein